ncbi:MAG: serine/threonine protein kinase, partial [Myxococcales bacterium]|nr:serine/threonine protein kinase [Myxococcales bacterium]
GVVHRDLKPANVLLAPTHDGLVPKVSDFGLVKPVSQVPAKGSLRVNTQSGMALGTPEYMSPEQIRDASDVDQRADMWAMGCILYELLCHRRAFSGPDKMSTFNLIVAGTYEPPRKFVDDLPRHVNEAIRRLLEVKQDDRLASAAELYDLLYDKEEPNVGRLSLSRRPTGPLLAASPHHEITIPPDDPVGSGAPVVISATAPTGIPAARRAQAPTGLRDQRPPAALLTQDSEPRPVNRTSLLIPALLVLVVVLSVTVVGLYLALPGQQVEQGLAPMLPPPGEHELTLPPPPPSPPDEPEEADAPTDGA